ncbi:unnamed protein product, partial [Hymenolepis diminuta]|uniref:Exostosin domain-containing protein n=1 Tax=Hymenolepis diminuta TaxID=6216 RepID=A0A0R3SKM1_HYMDI
EASDNESAIICPQKENSQLGEVLFLNQKYETNEHGKTSSWKSSVYLCLYNWSPTPRMTTDSPYEEHRSFRRVFVAPGLIDVNYAKAEVFGGKYLLFEAPLFQ